ncbi:PIG-L family deacetylase [Brevibacterium sp. 50QC2O2]|uniref:PIG-L family deacetylase n=1 Tax=Brevibacterium TaxID=1696 RepID=UPI00211C41FE|nr:PIG-L family deacetylase [Brevibacterium sp. 68QC2CO]MCQ9387500.1 PIG-L family deacetylase [Brevibacterium sp. 50QC2O2]
MPESVQDAPLNAQVTGEQAARVLFVHAHPDDESITTGGTMARLIAAGAQVTLLTCTRGEGGEVIGEDSLHLEGRRAALAAHREGELAAAMRALRVTDHRFLGAGEPGGAGPGRPVRRFEDSGMVWGADGHAAPDPAMVGEALCAAPVAQVAAYIGAVIAQLRPHLVVTYGPGGGYGHPDHRRAHDATVAAVSALPTDAAPVLLYTEVPAEQAEAAFDPRQPGFAETGFAAGSAPTIAAEGTPLVAEDVQGVFAQKAAAMAAHATQITVRGEFFALSNGIGQRIGAVEYFTASGVGAVPRAVDHAMSVLDVIGLDSAPALSGMSPGQARAAAREAKAGRPGIAGYLYTLLLAVIVAVLGTLQHLNATAVDLAGQAVILPWGVVLSLAMAGVAMWHLANTYRSTLVVLLFAIVVSGVTFLFSQQSLWPGHDLLVTGTLRSLAWLFGPMIIAVVEAFTLKSLKLPAARR